MASKLPLPSILETLLRPANVPPVLYHYTTQAGLLGIITSREIWATHTQYLNDSQEFQHAVAVAMSQVALKLAAESNEDRKTVLQRMLDGLMPSIETINVFVCSFSECGDSVAQWRAYGDATGGFAVGFWG
jgi:hypothetical protein